ncbi:hypothetical protein BH09MYX1_BH09MYX1_44340 [soil metagenome]
MVQRNAVALRFLGCLVVSLIWTGAVGGGVTSCSPDDAPIPLVAGKPLPQDGRIPVEVSVGDAFQTVHVSRHAIENFAARWCLGERSFKTDTKMCGGDASSDVVQRSLAAISVVDEPSVTSLVMGAPDKCGETLCFERNDVCAGFLLEEIAKNADAREFEIGDGIEPLGTSVTLADLELTENELAAVGLGSSNTKLKQLRTQPLGAAGRAAVLRGSLNRFRRATSIAEELRVREMMGPAGPSTCAAEFAGRDASGVSTGLNAGADGSKPNWSDVYLETFVDAATEYTVVLPAAVTAMREAAEFDVRGRGTDVDEVETQWNGSYDSATAVAKLMAYGDVATPSADWTGPPGGMHFLGITQGPQGAATCPPARPSGNSAIAQAKLMKISPGIIGNSSYPSFTNKKLVDLLVAGYNEDQSRLGLLVMPLAEPEVLKRLKISADDLDRAVTYMKSEVKVFNFVETFDTLNPLLPIGFIHVPRLLSTNNPSKAVALQAPAISVQFLGSMAPVSDLSLSSPSYAQHGAISSVDKMKVTAMALFKAPSGPASVSGPATKAALLAFDHQAEIFVGSRRIELWFGVQTSNTPSTLSKLKVRIHGVPVAAGKMDGERYALVQGLDGLKCASAGTIDNVPCKPSDYLLLLNDTVGSLDPEMFDLSGGTFEQTVMSLVRPGNPTAPIAAPDTLYILRSEKQGPWKAFSGAVSAQGTGIIEADPTFTRRVFMPAGGTYDDIVANALLPDPDDCSRPAFSCAGLPLSMFPPLESEINGDQSSLPYERSWRKYLDEAKSAAELADKLGTEVVQAGLSMDQRREVAISELRDLCGAEADENGCGVGSKDVRNVTLGDLPLCSWQTNGQTCACQGSGCTGALRTCPIQLPVGTKATEQTCNDYVKGLVYGSNPPQNATLPIDKMIPVADALGIVSTIRKSVDTKPEPACSVFDRLRNDATLSPSKRTDMIRTEVMPRFNREFLAPIAQGMRYRELFGDHYELTYNGSVIFSTKRPAPQIDNSKTNPPCHVDQVDMATGATYWNAPVSCYISGGTCPPPTGSGWGWDGCDPTTFSINGQYDLLSLDTEPAALRTRWAWGFGHLRRSVATLGLITGQLDGMMLLGRVGAPARLNDTTLESWDRVGALSSAVSVDKEPAWVFHGTPFGQTDLRPNVRCVALGGVAGVDGDVSRLKSGRPLNYTSWLPNRIPVNDDNQNNYAVGSWAAQAPYLLQGFPCYDDDGAGPHTCATIGVDPQMPYCFIPPQGEWSPGSINQFAQFSIAGAVFHNYAGKPDGTTSGFIGTTVPEVASFTAGASWGVALQEMWQDPGGDFCADTSDPPDHKGAVWRSFCRLPETDAGNTFDTDAFMHRGQAQSGAPVYFSRVDVAPWVRPTKDSHGVYLFNLNHDTLDEFQYQVDRRGVYDAMELGCHADRRPVTKVVDCDALLGGNAQTAEDFSALVECYGQRVRRALGTYTVEGVPKPVIDAYQLNGGLLSASTGLGGELFDDMVQESSALRNIATEYGHVQDAYHTLAIEALELKSIDKEFKDQQLATDQAVMVQSLTSVAACANAIVAGSNLIGSFGSSGGMAAMAAAAEAAKSVATIRQLELARVVTNDQLDQKRYQHIERMIATAAQARDAASAVNQQVNAFVQAAARIKLVQRKADVAVARANFADNAGDKGSDPQYVNIVMRRTYNTALLRYQTALDRAKKAAFIARRAIELRFGVDLARMTSPLKLVDAPSTWANRICTMGGIDYSKIRSPDPDASVNGFKFGAPPLVGDDYANAFVGDYVRLLEDFVTSYPIDFPLKDGDDTAVLSLRDDVFGATHSCTLPGRNALYFSAAIGARDETTASAKTKGWFVRGCGTSTELPGSGWSGCVGVYASSSPALALDGIITTQGKTYDEVSLDGLPEAAIAYRITNEPCVPSSTVTCPPQTTTNAFGSVAQIVTGLASANYVASVYARGDTLANPNPYTGGNQAMLRIVRRSDETVVSSKSFTPGALWVRVEAAFVGEPGASYRVELVPSTQNAAISAPTQVSLLAAALQLETVNTVSDTASPWQKTDTSRDRLDPVCNDPTGLELRRRFQRKCGYVCSDGIKDKCAAQDPKSIPTACYYEANFAMSLEEIEAGRLIPSGQIAIGNFNFRHNEIGLNVTGTGVTNCDGVPQQSCYDNGFIQYTLIHNGDVSIRNWTGASLPAHMDTAFIEHGKALAAERVVTNPPSGADLGLMSPYMKGEYKGRPLEGLYTLRIYDSPSLRWERVRDIQLVTKYHYWTRFSK